MQASPATVVLRYQLALVVLRSFAGIVYLSNGLAKLFSFHAVTILSWHTYLINRDDALGIQKANGSHAPGFLHDLSNVIVDNWSAFQWLLTAGEVAVGLALLLGLAGRLTALGGLALALAPFIFTLGDTGTWTYDYLFEPVTMLVLLLAQPLPGLDARIPWQRWRLGWVAGAS